MDSIVALNRIQSVSMVKVYHYGDKVEAGYMPIDCPPVNYYSMFS